MPHVILVHMEVTAKSGLLSAVFCASLLLAVSGAHASDRAPRSNLSAQASPTVQSSAPTVEVVGRWRFEITPSSGRPDWWDLLEEPVPWHQKCQAAGEAVGGPVAFGDAPVGLIGDGVERLVIALRVLAPIDSPWWRSPDRAGTLRLEPGQQGQAFNLIRTDGAGWGYSNPPRAACMIAYVAFIPSSAAQHVGSLKFMAGPEAVASVQLTGKGYGSMPARPSTPPTDCAPYILLDTRGSDDPTGLSRPAAKFLQIFRGFARPSTVAPIMNPYPARGNYARFTGALLSLPAGYHGSVVTGKNWLRNKLRSLMTSCRSTKFVLTGYSQGAHVAGDIYHELSPAERGRVLGVALFGDPFFHPKDSSARGSFQTWRSGGLGLRRFGSARVFTYCQRGDPVCQGLGYPFSFAAHKQYHVTWATLAASAIASRANL